MAIRVCAKCKKVIHSIGIPYGGKYYHKSCFVCSYCDSKLTNPIITYKGSLYHASCNPASGLKICAYCRKPINGRWYNLGDKHYHQDCYHLHIEKKCSVCGQPIHDSYYCDNWGNYAHVSHDGKKTAFCFTCGRILSKNTKSIGSDAILCYVCASKSINTDAEVERCRKAVIAVFKSKGIIGIPENIPIKLCPHEDMEGNLGCIYSVKVRDPKLADFHIHMTSGLPELQFKGVLAHEMLHSWLTLYGRDVSRDECEGFCNLGEAFIYTKENTPLAHYLLKRMYKNADLVYGEGYRLQKERYEKLGWAGLLESLRHKQVL